MIRAKLWFRCAAMHDPVTPTIVKPAVLSWEAKRRQVDLTIERAFNGPELVTRMKGWVTVDVKKALAVVEKRGRLRVLDDRELVVEFESESDFEALNSELLDAFKDQMDLERL